MLVRPYLLLYRKRLIAAAVVSLAVAPLRSAVLLVHARYRDFVCLYRMKRFLVLKDWTVTYP
jgi:hypothetical protein